jgi:hypothetical protein
METYNITDYIIVGVMFIVLLIIGILKVRKLPRYESKTIKKST